MCGRFTLRTPPADLVEIFELLREPDLTPRFNIAPTQQIPVVRPDNEAREWAFMRWGLVPSWARDAKSGPPMINARAETIATKTSFRDAFKKRRCLIPADGFFEWQKTGGKTKVPHCIRLANDRPFAFAGLWETRRGEEDDCLESCTIITCDPNPLMAELHDRMPVILPPGLYGPWLDHQIEDVDALQGMLQPYPAEEMIAYPIATLVNSPRNESPECIARLSVPLRLRGRTLI
jgi:putative SOS response-associated peptidase YedK